MKVTVEEVTNGWILTRRTENMDGDGTYLEKTVVTVRDEDAEDSPRDMAALMRRLSYWMEAMYDKYSPEGWLEYVVLPGHKWEPEMKGREMSAEHKAELKELHDRIGRILNPETDILESSPYDSQS